MLVAWMVLWLIGIVILLPRTAQNTHAPYLRFKIEHVPVGDSIVLGNNGDEYRVKEAEEIISKSERFLYITDPRWGGFNNHITILRMALHLSLLLDATAVVQKDYELLSYVDVNLIKEQIPLIDSEQFSWSFPQLREVGILCSSACGRYICHQRVPFSPIIIV